MAWLHEKFCVTCLLTTIGCSILAAPRCAAKDTIRPDETDANPICVTDKWAVWNTRELVEKTRHFRAPRYIYRFYLQRVSDPTASLIHTMREVSSTFIATVTDGGTVVLENRGSLFWLHPDGTIEKDSAHHLELLKLYPDAALLHKRTGLEFNSVNFVPFKNHRLDFTSQVELIPAGISRFRQPVVRDGNRLAWIRYEPREFANASPHHRLDATLHIYNLKTSQHSLTKLSSPLLKGAEPTALGEDMVIAGGLIFDTTNGERLNPVHYTKKPGNIYDVFAIRYRIGYYIHKRELYAIDLLSPESPFLAVMSLPKPSLVAATNSGVIAWNGEKWKTLEWLKQWPIKIK